MSQQESTIAAKNARKARKLTVIQVITWGFLLAAAAISSTHIIELGNLMHVGSLGPIPQSWTCPIFVDGIAIVGKISMHLDFSERFRKSGFKLLMFGGLLSLGANVGVGSSLGARGFGALVVIGFMLLENHLTKADDAVVEEKEEEPEEAPKKGQPWSAERRAKFEAQKAAKLGLTPRQLAARQAAQTRKANQLARELEDMVDGKVPANAPVSPAAV